MKSSIVLFSLLLGAGLASAQESLPAEHVQKAVQLVTTAMGELKEAPFKPDGDAEKSVGIKAHDNIGLLAVPEKGLKAEAIAKAAAATVPVGQLWLRGIVVAKDGTAVASEKLRHVTVQDKENDVKVELYLLGVRRNDKALELVIFAKDKEALMSVPLEAAEATQTLPIEVEGKGEKGKEESAALIVKLLGKYKATIPIRALKN